MLDVIDYLRELLVDGTDLDADDTAERPFDWKTGTLYVFEETSSRTPIGPVEVREDFIVIAAIATNSGEEAVGQRSRAVTETLYAHRDRMLELVRMNPNVGPWADGNIQGASLPAYLRQLDLRGIAIRVSGYRLIG